MLPAFQSSHFLRGVSFCSSSADQEISVLEPLASLSLCSSIGSLMPTCQHLILASNCLPDLALCPQPFLQAAFFVHAFGGGAPLSPSEKLTQPGHSLPWHLQVCLCIEACVSEGRDGIHACVGTPKSKKYPLVKICASFPQTLSLLLETLRPSSTFTRSP